MVRMLICEDDDGFREKLRSELESALASAGVRAKVHAHGSMEGIGEPILNGCDIAFLDIDFTGKDYNGLDIARKLRAARKDAVILFVTNFIEYAPEGYEVQAFRYVLKSEISRKLPEYLHLALEQLQAVRQTIKIQINGELIDIPLAEILYIESQQHMVTVYARKTYSYYASLSALERQLEPHGFLRIHKSYLVNMARLKKYQCKEAVLDDGTVLRVSEKSYGEQKKQYLLWKGRQL